MKWEKFEAGYAMPVKSWCENCEDGAVIPAAVGVDIGCGMIVTETDIPAEASASSPSPA